MGSVKLGPWGGSGGQAYDIGSTGSVRIASITVRYGDAIDSLAFEYVVDGKTHTAGPWGGSGGNSTKITFASGEYLQAIKGTHGRQGAAPNVVTSLTFISNEKTYGPFGKSGGTPFDIPVASGRFVGFFGRAGNLLDSIGVYIVPEAGRVKLGLWGGNGGQANDINHEGSVRVDSVTIRYGDAVDSLAFTYVVDGKTFSAGPWGGSGGTRVPITFGTGEYLTAISGTHGQHANLANVITSIKFVTNVKTYGPYGKETGTYFSIPVIIGRFVGFYGRAGTLLDAIGVYMMP